MKQILSYFLLLFTALSLLFTSCTHSPEKTSSVVSADSLARIAEEAYVYGFPLVEFYKGRNASSVDTTSKRYAPFNSFRYLGKLATPSDSIKNGPNNDTPYFSAWIDVSKEPVVVHVPDHKDRYYSLQFVDFFTENAPYIGTRATGNKEGRFLLTPPNWKGKVPEGVTPIQFRTNYLLAIGRTLVYDPKELPEVIGLQKKITLTPLSVWPAQEGKYQGTKRPDLAPYYAEKDSFFVNLNQVLTQNPTLVTDSSLFQRFSLLGLGAGKSFSWNAFDKEAQEKIKKSIAETDAKLVAQEGVNYVDAGNNWVRTHPSYGKYDANYLLRATLVRWGGVGGHSPEEAFYLFPKTDDKGDSLTGSKKYVLHFDKGQLPPVKSFWSITPYSLPGLYMSENPIQRYAIGDRTKGFKYNADGSLDVYVQNESPGKEKEANWLPVSKNKFTVCARVYVPEQALLDGQYKFPVFQRLD